MTCVNETCISEGETLYLKFRKEIDMVFQDAEDVTTLKKVGINVAVLVGVMLALIALSVVIG